MTDRKISVTDRAIVAYLEFAWGADIDGLRDRIARRAASAFRHDAKAVVIDGLIFVRVGDEVVSVNEKPKRKNRRLRLRAKP